MKLGLLLSLLFQVVCLYGQNESLKLGSDVWPPFTNEEGKNSFAIDLVKEALNRRGVSVQTEFQEFGKVMTAINNQECDGSAALWYSDQRSEFLLFSDPYLHNQLVLVGRKGMNVSVTQLDQLKDKKVAVVENYAYGAAVDSASNIEIVMGQSDQHNLDALLKEEVDYILVDALLIQYLLKYQQQEANQFLEIAQTPLFTKSLHFAIRKDTPNAEAIIKNFNNEIILMIADGSYNRILNLNWIKADINGDGQMELVLNGDRAGQFAPTNSYSVHFDNSQKDGPTKGYYIDGKYYQSWEQVPNKYKQPQVKSEDMGKIGALSFRF